MHAARWPLCSLYGDVGASYLEYAIPSWEVADFLQILIHDMEAALSESSALSLYDEAGASYLKLSVSCVFAHDPYVLGHGAAVEDSTASRPVVRCPGRRLR